MVNCGEERSKFSELSLDYMSEESSSDEDFIVHPPAWRSNGNYFCSFITKFLSFFLCHFKVLTKFLRELDKRVDDKHNAGDAKQKRKIPDRKPRIQGSPLSSCPPALPPKWTISKD